LTHTVFLDGIADEIGRAFGYVQCVEREHYSFAIRRIFR